MANNWTELPLAINMIGPMVFKQSGDNLNIWLPRLDAYKHQAGIGTNLDSFVFPDNGNLKDFSLMDPNPRKYPRTTAAYHPSPYYLGTSAATSLRVCTPYIVEPKKYPPENYFIHITLPRPKWIVGLNPVSCTIQEYDNQEFEHNIRKNYQLRPVGFRLLYESAGTPVLTSDQDRSFMYYPPFDPAPEESQLEMFISYAPFVYTSDEKEAEYDFKKLGEMLGLNLELKIEPPSLHVPQHDRRYVPLGPLHNCKTANITLL